MPPAAQPEKCVSVEYGTDRENNIEETSQSFPGAEQKLASLFRFVQSDSPSPKWYHIIDLLGIVDDH
jgi:hypothetical protein